MTPSADIEQIYRDEGDRLYYAILAYSGEPDVAREAVAEAFARALASESSIRDVVPWIWRVAFRVASNDLSSRDGTLERRVPDGVETCAPAGGPAGCHPARVRLVATLA